MQQLYGKIENNRQNPSKYMSAKTRWLGETTLAITHASFTVD